MDDELIPRIGPSDGASPEHLFSNVTRTVSGELNSPAYPSGAYALYRIICEHADTGQSTLNLVEMIDQWASPKHPGGSPTGLNTITQVLDCADALTKGGFLRREPDGLFERWTPLAHGNKRAIPHKRKRSDVL